MAPPGHRAPLQPLMPPPVGALVGPTGSGKTELALAIAGQLPIEILVADSRQVYRGMSVGTAKPDVVARNAVRHHLLDLVDPDQPFSVADWVARAREIIPQVAERGALPVLVGGTGLYLSALIDGFHLEAQPRAPQIGERLRAELAREGPAILADRLRSIDPDAAALIDLRNPRRVLRALERAEAAGGPAAELVTAEPYPGPVVMIGIRRPREELYRRIDVRAAALFEDGLLDEVRALLADGFDASLPPLTGHGYREAARVLTDGWSVDMAIAQTARHTRQYAKRQLTWFRRDPRIVWLEAGNRPADEQAIVERAVELFRPLSVRALAVPASG
jgi:tRNA dimethylallyltransferase